ncbi:hypothetical protein PLEOSDRAFT_1087681 [Pleurotus ostreatus PC15]|uniref:Uncharacterized protein n=1 Tax=Pleurotus ostreatus (strain PC15) TaxID=1137138 RepID=A0A067NYX6_PLEO1|nr:hypothetical protein PLEOSDRAFT_1087681 [Pleurotus ostreatus PC15]
MLDKLFIYQYESPNVRCIVFAKSTPGPELLALSPIRASSASISNSRTRQAGATSGYYTNRSIVFGSVGTIAGPGIWRRHSGWM